MKQTGLISLFLAQAKEFAEERPIIFVERDENIAFLSERGMTVENLEEIILGLSFKDCFDGPEPDRDPKYSEHWTVAEFSPTHNGEKLYLKLSVRVDKRRCKCLSVKLWIERNVR